VVAALCFAYLSRRYAKLEDSLPVSLLHPEQSSLHVTVEVPEEKSCGAPDGPWPSFTKFLNLPAATFHRVTAKRERQASAHTELDAPWRAQGAAPSRFVSTTRFGTIRPRSARKLNVDHAFISQ